jgi:hypothetical protein
LKVGKQFPTFFMRFTFATLIAFCSACSPPSVNRTTETDKVPDSLTSLYISDDSVPPLPDLPPLKDVFVNADSIRKAALKKIGIRSGKEIQNATGDNILQFYELLHTALLKAGDSSSSIQNQVLAGVFENLNSKENELKEAGMLEPDKGLKIARLKSDIYPYFLSLRKTR